MKYSCDKLYQLLRVSYPQPLPQMAMAMVAGVEAADLSQKMVVNRDRYQQEVVCN